MMISSSRAVVWRSTVWKKVSNSTIRRFKATLQVEREERAAANAPQEHGGGGAGRLAENKKGPFMAPRRVLLDGMTNNLIDIRPGEMNLEQFGEAKYLVSQNCKKGRPEDANRLLERMITECRLQPRTYALFRSLFNIVISAWATAKKPEEAEQVFAQMLHCHAELPNVCPAPDRYSYNALLTAWASSRSSIAIERVMEIFNEMEGSDSVQPDAYTYNIVMGAYAARVGEYGAAKAAEDILLRYSERHMRGLVSPGPETMSFNIVMKAWSNSRDEKGPDRAMEIYSLMEKLHAEGHEHVNPDSISLIALMSAYAAKGDVDMVEKLLRETTVQGDLTNCYNSAISAHAKSGNAEAGDHAERLLAMMDNADDTTHLAVLNAHARANRPDAAARTEDFLGRSVESYLKYKTDIRPNKKLFHVVLKAWKDHTDVKEAAERSLALLKDMQGLANEWQLQTRPDTSTYSFVIELWARVDVQKAGELLKEVEARDEVPFIRSYNAVLEALSKQHTHESLVLAMNILEKMERNGATNTYGYNFVFYNLNKHRSEHSKAKVLEYLDRMEQQFRDGDKSVRPNMRTYTNVLNCISVEPNEQDARTACSIFDRMTRLHHDPRSGGTFDIIGHTIILMILSRTRLPYAAEKATDIFDLMLSENYHVLPDAGCMSSVILANARAPNSKYTHVAHDRLVNLLRLYLDGKVEHYPYAATVTAVLHAWSRCREECAAEKASELLALAHEMQAAGVEGFVPNSRIFCSYFTVFSNSVENEGGEEAEKILDTLDETDAIMWNAVLNIWAKSNHPQKALRTQRCVQKMKDTESAPMPDQFQFNAILNAAAFSGSNSPEQRKEALDVAVSTFDEIKSSTDTKPDHVSYGSIMKCYRLLMDPSMERAAIVREIFEECKENGYVGHLVLRELNASLRPKDFQKAVGESAQLFSGKLDIELLPKEFRRNVPANKWNRGELSSGKSNWC